VSGAPGPLDGLVVVDFTRVLAGPLCTMILSDMGAEVVKVERPGTGDDTRSWDPPAVAGDATYFLGVNRGKKSVVLDLSTPEDAETARRLVAGADVVIENFRSGVMHRLGLGYEDVRALNPAVVYCSIPAFASSETPKPGYDLLMQALSGLMSVTGVETPTKVGVALLDVVTGLYATSGVLAALNVRDRTGVGQQVTVGLYDASLAALVNQSAAYLLAGHVPTLAGNGHPSIVPYQAFEARDRTFVLAAGNDKLFRDTMDVLGMPVLADDPRFSTNRARVENREVLVKLLDEAFRAGDAADWVQRLEDRGVPAAVIRSLDEVFTAEESQAALVDVPDPARGGSLRYVRTPIRLSATPLRDPVTPPPRLGQHTASTIAALSRTDPSPSDGDRPPEGSADHARH
jgi:crotonobetainyl-CoA:carnitine CoA-transferase CaiB-like acyl-CoA transferase